MTEPRKIRLGALEIDLDKLTHFIVKAKQNGYAGSDVAKREADGSKTVTFQEGDFHYTDNYAGSNQAPGDEIVRWQKTDGQRIWHMAYSGGMHPEFWNDKKLREETFTFLREALMQVSFEHPFRGPRVYRNDQFIYEHGRSGDISRFLGTEMITKKRPDIALVFSQNFIGGLVVPK
jgi:hypothetical protein